MAYSYAHSASFDALKDIRDIPVNLSTQQYLDTLDRFLYSAAQCLLFRPVIYKGERLYVATDFFRSLLWSFVSWGSLHPRRKISTNNRNVTLDNIVAALLNGNELTLESVRRFELDRVFVSSAIDRVISLCRDSDMDMQQHHSDIAIKDAVVWMHYYYEWRNIVTMKYVRLVLNHAQRDYRHYFNHRIPLDDLIEVYLVALYRAVDKCSSELGVLTTYIGNWMKTAKGVAAAIHAKNHENMVSTELLIEGEGDFKSSTNVMAEISIKQDLARVKKMCDFVGEGVWDTIAESYGVSLN